MKNLLLILTLIVSSNLMGQAPVDSFVVAGVTGTSAFVNGTYEISTTSILGCPCYDRKEGPVASIYIGAIGLGDLVSAA